MKTIVVGYDGTRAAERALGRAAELAKAFGSRVVVVSVSSPEPEPLATRGAFGLIPYYYPPSAEELGQAPPDQELLEQHRDRVLAYLAEAGVPAEFEGVLGAPAETIVELAVHRDADLIVVGTRQPGFVDRLLGGSVSQSVARRAPCDVLIVPPPADDD